MEKEVILEEILELVCADYGITTQAAKLPCRKPMYADCRKIFWRLAVLHPRRFTQNELAAFVGRKEHATVYNGLLASYDFEKTDKKFKERLDRLTAKMEIGRAHV